jgi:DNA-directed RNA polymerase subunit RPC12/RpoP
VLTNGTNEIQDRLQRIGRLFLEVSAEFKALAEALATSESSLMNQHSAYLEQTLAQASGMIQQLPNPQLQNQILKHPRRRKRSVSLADAHPEIAKLWNTERNGIEPSDVARTSPKKYWWKCPDCQYEWEASVLTQVMRKYPCQNCASQQKMSVAKKALKPISRRTTETLAELYPNIAKEWHPYLNGDLTPDKVSAKSQERAWWICSNCNKPFRARIGNRTIGTRCPECRHLTTG